MGSRSRRRLLATVPPAALSATAGCVSVVPGFGHRKRFELAHVDIFTFLDAGHDVTLRISRDGEQVFEGEYSIGPADSETDEQRIDHDWMSVMGLYAVEVETDWGSTVSTSTDYANDLYDGEYDDHDCARFTVALRADETVGMYVRFFETCP